ncbi:tetratricopeptide repeat protein [Streptomyces olivoreticuli]
MLARKIDIRVADPALQAGTTPDFAHRYWSKASDMNPLTAGVHRAQPLGTHRDTVPAYVPRDIDHELREHLRHAIAHGGLLLLLGDSTAGKTRTMFEALRAEGPDHRVVTPRHASDIPAAIKAITRSATPCVLWLDELQRFLGPSGLHPEGLAELAHARTPVLATMRTEQFEAYTPRAARDPARRPTDPEYAYVWAGADVLNHAAPFVLARCWSNGERERARGSADPRVADAAHRHPHHGIAEYLAVGHALLQEWLEASRAGGYPRGAALVRAAVDLVRTGVIGPLSSQALLAAHHYYLVDAGGPRLRPESVEDAFAWAGQVRFGTASLLLPAGHDTWEPFDYLVDSVQRDGSAAPVHPLVWFAAAEHSPNINSTFRIALNASRTEPMIATFLWEALTDAGLTRAANNLGVTLIDRGRYEEAEAVLRKRADTSDPTVLLNLGNALQHMGRQREAENVYREAANLGHPAAWNNLGLLFQKARRLNEAQEALLRAAQAGDGDAEFNLGVVLTEVGKPEEAMAAYQRAYEAGDRSGLNNWGILLADAGDIAEAKVVLRKAIEAGDTEAVFTLANILKGASRLDEAENWYRKAIEGGDPRASFNLANLYRDTNRIVEAEPLYRGAVNAGIRSAVFNLGLLLESGQRWEDASELFQQAVDDGTLQARLHLGHVLAKAGRIEEAKDAWRKAAAEGDTTAAIGLATIMKEPEEQDELRFVFRRAAAAGDTDAQCVLAALSS